MKPENLPYDEQQNIFAEVHEHLSSANALLGRPGLLARAQEIQRNVLKALNDVNGIQNDLEIARVGD